MTTNNNNIENIENDENIQNDNKIDESNMESDDGIIKYNYTCLEEGTELLKYRTFHDVKKLMNEKFGYKEGELSIILDIISVYLKGQKTLYLEAQSYCEFYLNRLMMPCIFLSSLCSVISGIFNEAPLAGKCVAGATAINAFLMSIISYYKLDARAEAHKMTAYSFDQLISECEFTSGKILLSNTCISLNPGALSDEKVEKYDLVYVQNFIKNIEQKVREIKDKNQFTIPNIIRHRFVDTYNANIFIDVKNIQIDELKLFNQLKVICNSCADIENIIIKGDKRPVNYKLSKERYLEKNKCIEKILEHRKKLLKISDDLMREIVRNRNKSSCRIFY